MEISFKNKIIKNDDYLRAKDDYLKCTKNTFDRIKLNSDFDDIINSPANSKICKYQIEELKKIVLEGGLDYENFKN
jgi:hypothetical protein